MPHNKSAASQASLKTYEQVIADNLKAVVPEELQLSANESQDYEKLANAASLIGTYQDIRERKKFAKWIFWMVVGWLVVILGIIICTGRGLLQLSDAVVLALIGSTTVNITAFFVIVTKYLFPSKTEG